MVVERRNTQGNLEKRKVLKREMVLKRGESYLREGWCIREEKGTLERQKVKALKEKILPQRRDG